MIAARVGICLGDLGIPEIRSKRAFTEVLILELPGADNQKAEKLVSSLKKVLTPIGEVRVTGPGKIAEMRVRDFDSATREDISLTVAEIGACDPSEVRVGSFREVLNGLRTAWIRCPLATAKRVAGKDRVGFLLVRVDQLDSRLLQCFKCLERGHVRQHCGSVADRSRCCYKCGIEGHLVQACTAPPNCPVCSDLGRPARHRVGGPVCTAPPRRAVRSHTGVGPTPPSAAAQGPTQPDTGSKKKEGIFKKPLSPTKTRKAPSKRKRDGEINAGGDPSGVIEESTSAGEST